MNKIITHRLNGFIIIFNLLWILGITVPDRLTAHPQFATQRAVLCGQCHVNAQGGGLRNDYGADYYSKTVLPMKKWQKFGDSDFTATVNDYIRYGADLRMQYYYYADQQTSQNAFFPMQADLYLGVQPFERFQLYLEQSLFNTVASADVWAQYSLPDDKGYLRFGQFVPAYGLRMADHTSFIRGGNVGGLQLAQNKAGIAPEVQGLQWKPSNNTVGIEGAVKLKGVRVTGSVGKPKTGREYSFTLNAAKAFWAGDYNLLMGANYFNGDYLNRGWRYAYSGLYLGINRGPFTFLGEADITSDYTERGATGYATMAMLAYQVTQGFYLDLKHDFYDADVQFTGDSMTRYTLGLDLFPLSYIELLPQYRLLTLSTDKNYARSEVIIQGHFWF